LVWEGGFCFFFFFFCEGRFFFFSVVGGGGGMLQSIRASSHCYSMMQLW